jgi:hypothetical protein
MLPKNFKKCKSKSKKLQNLANISVIANLPPASTVSVVTYLGSLGSSAATRILSFCCCAAQEAKVSINNFSVDVQSK